MEKEPLAALNTDGVVQYISELQQSLDDALKEREGEREKLQDALTSVSDGLAKLQDGVNDEIAAFHEKVDDTLAPVVASLASGEKDSKTGAKEADRSSARRYRQYFKRQSLLVTLLQQNHFTTIWNIAVSFVILAMLRNIIENLFQGKEPVDLSLLENSFLQWRMAAVIWMGMFALAWSLWFFLRHKCSFRVATAVYVPHVLVMAIIPAMISHQLKLPPGSAMIVSLEAWRFCMKMHSFTYTRDFQHVDAAKKKNDDASSHDAFVSVRDMFFGNILDSEKRAAGQYLYFLFAPTLLWRSEYPRAPHRVAWLRVLWYMCEFGGVIIYLLVVLGDGLPEIQGNELSELKLFLRACFNNALSATMCLLLAFYGLLHIWLNLWAELLRFADRQFYQDWWNAPNFSVFYRKWNGVVHDFLHEHIYQAVIDANPTDAKTEPAKHRAVKTRALLVTFAFSALVHEYALWASFGFLRPYLLVVFGGLGTVFALLPRTFPMGKMIPRIEGIIFWTFLSIGSGLLFVCYRYSYLYYSRGLI